MARGTCAVAIRTRFPDAHPMQGNRDRIATAFGRALRRARERRGLSQEELAFRAQVDRTFISRAERGVRQPALATVFLLAKALGIRPGTLVDQAARHANSSANSSARSSAN